MRRLAGIGVAIATTLTFLAISAVGCGSSDDSKFGDPNGASSGGPGGPGFGNGEGGTGGPESVVSPTSACATSNAGADLLGVNLVFMVDRSGSMADNMKWPSSKAALEAFFADPASKGLWASLSFFAQPNECGGDYTNPDAPMRALPDAKSFSVRLDPIVPDGNTPTLPAVQGAIAYAQTVKATLKPGEKVVVVLVTDGDPNGCNSDPDNVAAEAAKVAATIPMYVIGVGPDAKNLNTIATGGGTAPAIMIATSNPAQITADLTKAIGAIKKASLGCNYGLPAPPAGKALDIASVNVNYTPGGGKLTTLPYSADCSKANGWHYDSPVHPTQIVMCPASCATLQADKTGGAIDIVFGCATVGDPPK